MSYSDGVQLSGARKAAIMLSVLSLSLIHI